MSELTLKRVDARIRRVLRKHKLQTGNLVWHLSDFRAVYLSGLEDGKKVKHQLREELPHTSWDNGHDAHAATIAATVKRLRAEVRKGVKHGA